MDQRVRQHQRRSHWRAIAGMSAALLLMHCGNALAAPLRIAVSANFKSTLETLVAAYAAKPAATAETPLQPAEHQPIDIIAGATGTLYAQIVNGAPYEIFLAADSLRPRLLVEAGFASSKSRFIYATGQLVFWAPSETKPVSLATLMTTNSAIAIANPALAPYGVAAQSVIDHFKPDHKTLVHGNNINQTFQFVESGNAAAGFVALSQVQGRSAADNWWLIPAAIYPPVHQQAVVLNNASPAAWQFAEFLRSNTARQIIREAGNLTPASP